MAKNKEVEDGKEKPKKDWNDEFEQKFVGAFPARRGNELRIAEKVRKGPGNRPFMEIREWWYRDGPENEPVPTKNGVAFPESSAATLVSAMLSIIKPGNCGAPQLIEIREQLRNLESRFRDLNADDPSSWPKDEREREGED